MLNKKFHAAFPQPDFLEQGTTGVQGDPGMSLRDYFAAKAMQALCAGLKSGDKVEHLPTFAYLMADAMLKERNK